MTKHFSNLRGLIVGLGSIGNRHLNNLCEMGVSGMTVVRRAGSPNQQFAPPANVSVSLSLDDALSNRPDFAVICNPTHLHAVTATKCLEAGVHVLIEKPLGRDLGSDEKRLVEIATASDRVCGLAYCMRYHPAYQAAREIIRNGEIGKCHYAKAWFEGYLPDWHPWEDHKDSYASSISQGGGALRTLDHELDFMNWVLGPALSAIGFAQNTSGIQIEADDLAMYQMRHGDGVMSQITTSLCRKPQSRGFEFVGSNGTISFRVEEGKLLRKLANSPHTETIIDSSSYNINQMYVDLAQNFLLAVNDVSHSTTLPTLGQAVCNMQLIQQIGREPS